MTTETTYLLLDTGVLLLLLVARVDIGLLLSFKRMNNFTLGDHELLSVVLKRFQYVITTPHTLAEVSNFVDQSPPHRRKALMAAFATFIREQQEHDERAVELVARPEFATFGVADTALASLSDRATVLTADARLYARISAAGGRTINFEHLRGEGARQRGATHA